MAIRISAAAWSARTRPILLGCLLPITLLFSGGCATVPYQFGQDIERPNTLALRPGEPQIERGKPNQVLDTIGWIIGIPSKIILLDSRVDNHRIGTNTEQAIKTYLADNDLNNVKVRLNQYAPGGEWSRWHRNKAVGWGWKYTLGLLNGLLYTLLPGRIIGGDHYNPFTNTINLYSNHPAIALHEGGHAKDFARRKYKGTYAFFYALPFAALYPEALATGDAVGYLRTLGTAEEEKQAYRILYPAYMTYVGGSYFQYVSPYSWVFVVAVIPGHVAGRIKAGGVDERRQEESEQTESRR